ncbi:SubName: Full=Uncharacterized protein {ECO:0000313/EMBL:CCA72244.1} [Serendipita indica DSM 11827]|uniref:Uncharacterized protein n=1 Tax=Serendipita indica (strain DSM 11827) TaxID=1109443 RepID=G4TLP8_SERID|nr:SubName: Full=Uncharacterized protein {ECO:0000313/EMBL:CCA72244.1} [Serendipita indica DSM 11827]CCA72244.1 hypothetical protein PIIN_06178 [Serendipita indica DSM 11827]
MASTSSSTPAASGSAVAAGKQRQTGDQQVAEILHQADELVEKIKQTASNVTTCQAQIDQVFGRCNSLVEALRIDSKSMDIARVKEAAQNVEETLKYLQKHMLRFAIYGRPKAFVNREEIAAFFEEFNINMDKVLKSFAVTPHPDVEDWESEYYQAKVEDESDAFEQLDSIVTSESDMKIIMELGEDAVTSLKRACKGAIEDPNVTAESRKMLQLAMESLQSRSLTDPNIVHPTSPPTHTRTIANLRAQDSQRPSSSSRPHSSTSLVQDAHETPAARAKREEAERERAMADGAIYDETPLPRWEPRRPPPGRGPGSIDGTTDTAQRLEHLAVSDRPMEDVPDDLPPSYQPPKYSA